MSDFLPLCCFFFFNDTATTEIYTVSDTLSLHDALPISRDQRLELRRASEMPPRDHRAVLEPEVEQVAVDEERVAQIGHGVEEGVKTGLDCGRDLSQVSVGDHEHARGWHGPKVGIQREGRKLVPSFDFW